MNRFDLSVRELYALSGVYLLRGPAFLRVRQHWLSDADEDRLLDIGDRARRCRQSSSSGDGEGAAGASATASAPRRLELALDERDTELMAVLVSNCLDEYSTDEDMEAFAAPRFARADLISLLGKLLSPPWES